MLSYMITNVKRIHSPFIFFCLFFGLFVALIRLASDNLVLTLIHIEKCVEFVQPCGFGFEFFFLIERFFHIDLCRFILRFDIVKLLFVHFQTLRKSLKSVIQTGNITEGICSERHGITEFALELDLVFLFKGVKGYLSNT